MRRHLPTLLTVILLAAPAAGQDSAPVIEELQDGNGVTTTQLPQGGILWIKGRNLHRCPVPEDPVEAKKFRCKHEELEVTLDGDPIAVWDSTFDLITAQIPPNAKIGKSRIRVEIRGRGKAEARLEIMSMEKYREAHKGEGNFETPGGALPGQKDAGEALKQEFKITKFAMVPGAAGSRFEVEGVVPDLIPDGFWLDLNVMFDNRSLFTRRVEIADKGFRGTFGPFREKLLYGIYECRVTFEVGQQSRAALRRWERSRRRSGARDLKKEEQEALQRIERRELVEVGTGPQNKVTPEDRKRQIDALQAHVKKLHDEAGKLYGELEEVWAVAARCRFKQAGQSSYDKERYRAWLVRQKYAEDDKAAEAIEKDTRFGTASGHFKAQEYETWVTKRDGFISHLQALAREQVAFNTEYICPIDDRAKMLGDYLLSILERTLQNHAQELYRRSRLDVPAAINALRLENVVPAPEDGKKYFYAKRRELLRQVGLDDFVE